MNKTIWVCIRCRDKKKVQKDYELVEEEVRYNNIQGECDLKCGRWSIGLWPVRKRSVLEKIAEAAKDPPEPLEVEARTVTEKDEWGVARVVGGFGDVG